MRVMSTSKLYIHFFPLLRHATAVSQPPPTVAFSSVKNAPFIVLRTCTWSQVESLQYVGVPVPVG